MGDPKKHRKKYETPRHPWNKARIEEEKELIKEFGLANKKEIYKMNSLLRSFFLQAKQLITKTGEQAEKERAQLLGRLQRSGLLSSEAGFPEVLGISLKDLLERRLQTMVYKKMLANSVKQARQFITHKHIMINEKIITAPSYLVSLNEELVISFIAGSALSNPDHPERAAVQKKNEAENVELPEKKSKKKEDKKVEKKEGKKTEKKDKKPKKEEKVKESDAKGDAKNKKSESKPDPKKSE